MKTRKVSAKRIVLVMVVVALIVVYVSLFLSSLDDSPQQRRVRLLCHTDHEALLQAGRQILRQGPKDPMNYRPYGPIHIDGFPVPRGVPIPKVIRKLRPHACLINFNGHVVVQMQGGIADFGVKIYPEGFSRPSRYFKYGNKELLPGLWYYDYRYSHDPEYNKRIDEIMQTGRWPEPNKESRTQETERTREK